MNEIFSIFSNNIPHLYDFSELFYIFFENYYDTIKEKHKKFFDVLCNVYIGAMKYQV